MILTYKPNIFLSGVFLAVICAIAAQPYMFAQTAAEKVASH